MIETNSFVSNQDLFASIPEAAFGQYGHQVAVPNSICGVDGYQASVGTARTQKTTALTMTRVTLFIDAPSSLLLAGPNDQLFQK